MYDTLSSTLSAVMRGLLLTALIQGVAIGLGLLVTGVPYWAFLAVVSAACGLLPFGGTAIVWVPAVLYLGYFSSWTIAIVLAIWCVIWVAIIDNFIKPLAMRHGTGLPTIALFFGLAGGLEVYGPIGIFAGRRLFRYSRRCCRSIAKTTRASTNRPRAAAVRRRLKVDTRAPAALVTLWNHRSGSLVARIVPDR